MVSTVPMESPPHTNKEAPKASVERGLLMKLPLLKLTKFSDPDITAMSDKLFGDSPAKPRGQLKPKPKLTPTTTVITVTNLTGPATTLPDSPPLFGELVERDPLNQLMAIMDAPMDIMDTVMAPESPDILLVPLTPSEAPKVLASKMQYVAS